MKLGVLTVLLQDRPLEEALKLLKARGVQMIELGAGGCPGKAHCNPQELLADAAKLDTFRKTVADSGLEISALSCHGNNIHPDPAVAKMYRDDYHDTVLLAEKLGLDTIVTFSGCAGGKPGDMTPNWITCPWPTEFSDMLEYQWNDVLIPYWQEASQFAADHGIKKIAIEMHPGFQVYGPESMMRLRNAVGPIMGANFDPSHLFWQGIDMPSAIRYLGDAIHYVHAKDSRVDPINAGRTGVLDTKHYADEINRSWIFRSVGYGHSVEVWKDIVSNLRMVGYDGVMSIEHEDSLMSPLEGLDKAIAVLKEAMVFQDVGEMFWA